jgi:subfamily B ATP-binding cassette protein MsbA
MEGGRIVEQGSHEALLQADGLYAHLHRIQYQQQAA